MACWISFLRSILGYRSILNEGNKFKYINIDSSSGIKETFSNQIGFIDYNKDGKSDFVHTNCPACGDRGVNLYENNQFSNFAKNCYRTQSRNN